MTNRARRRRADRLEEEARAFVGAPFYGSQEQAVRG